MRFFLGILLCFMVSSQLAFGQVDTSSFNVRVFGAEDIVPPTIPTLLSATAVAYNQIDVSWSTVTDNAYVAGYVLFRDSVAISTTSLTSYTDIGLTGSTTYQYSVRAFDASFNYSSSSNNLVVTTPVQPVAPVAEEGGSSATASRIVLNNLTVTSGFSTSTFFIQTARPARFEMRWGRTTSYELGYIANERYSNTYKTTITDLEPGTTYQYEVVGYTPQGQFMVLERGEFTTLGPRDFALPSNVSRFSAIKDGNAARLSWQPPKKGTYEYVRIVRNYLSFPTHPQDGAIIYQGDGESFFDGEAFKEHSVVYYTAFVFDESGNISSGAALKIFAHPVESSQGEVLPIEEQEEGVASTSVSIPPGVRMPDLSEIFLSQEKISWTFRDREITVDPKKDFTLSIPREAIFSNLKTIIATLTDPTDSRKTYSFLLRLNKDTRAYEAVVAPVQVQGLSRIVIDVYDYKTGVVATYTKSISFVENEETVPRLPIFPDYFITHGLMLLSIVGLPCVVGLVMYLFYRRRRTLEDNK